MPSLIRPMAIPATGRSRSTPASINASEPPQTVAIEEDPFDSVISDTRRMVYGKSSFASSSGRSARRPACHGRFHGPAADTARFTDRIGREVIMQHEVRAALANQRINDLFILARAKRGNDHGLSFTTGEQGRSVGRGRKPASDNLAHRLCRARQCAVGLPNRSAYNIGFLDLIRLPTSTWS